MSQQSNPATLREALEALPFWRLTESAEDGMHTVGYMGAGEFVRRDAVLAALAARGTEAAPVTCESCKSTNTQRYENAGGLKMYSCADCGWHHFVPVQDAASPEGETKLTRLLDRLDERIAEHDQQQIPSNIRDWLEIEIAAMLRQSASPEAAPRLIATEIGPVLARLGTSTGNVAAASPEGEGRETAEWWHEATLDVCRHARAHDPIDWQSAINGGLLRAYNRGLDARQPAAPSEGAAAAQHVDWMQVLLNLMNGQESGRDGQPCFHVDREGIEERFCLRAKFWAGHDDMHKFVSLADLLAQESMTGAVTETK